MPPRATRFAASLLLLSAVLQGGCATPVGPPPVARDPYRVEVDLSGKTLVFRMPTLGSSQDFGRMTLATDIDLAQVVKPKTILFGHWDGPRYQVLSVTGTLNLWMQVMPWPELARAAQGCEAKVRAYVDHELQMERERFARGGRSRPPVMDSEPVSVGGWAGAAYSSSYDEGDRVYYVFPVDGQFALWVMIHSIDNSGMSGRWAETSSREKGRFLGSLSLAGGPGDCGS